MVARLGSVAAVASGMDLCSEISGFAEREKGRGRWP